MAKIKHPPLKLHVQAEKLRRVFPGSKVSVCKSVLLWRGSITPSFLSQTYDIKLEYKAGYNPCVYVVNKKLDVHPDKKVLPHVYNHDKQWLCLYYRKAHEWSSQRFITDTIIPWTSEWLLHYEFWLGSGKWFGKGIHGTPKPYQSAKVS